MYCDCPWCYVLGRRGRLPEQPGAPSPSSSPTVLSHRMHYYLNLYMLLCSISSHSNTNLGGQGLSSVHHSIPSVWNRAWYIVGAQQKCVMSTRLWKCWEGREFLGQRTEVSVRGRKPCLRRKHAQCLTRQSKGSKHVPGRRNKLGKGSYV